MRPATPDSEETSGCNFLRFKREISFPGRYRIPYRTLRVRAGSLMPAAGLMRANRFVWHIADTALDAVVDTDLAYGAERFVVKSWDP
jgi:hypothetical protein